ncbi:uncharacterized protein LOC126609074 [Malus sylvestris]|uniref:uncharacterized protein LOC126609074 n=1 Tax=Malus sylvestris TaxID=3752 RepID=UPI0021AC3C99|nr:uncharacterized protein LOC126609074 [Malus sylvestris]
MAGVYEKNNVAAAAAEDNLAGSSRSGEPIRNRNSYQWNPRDEPLVHEPAACQPPVLLDPPPTPHPRREAECHFPVLESKEAGLWLHLDDMDYMHVWTGDSGSLIQGHGLSAGDTVMLFKDDQLGSYLIRARRDAVRPSSHPTTHNTIRLPSRLPYDPLQDFEVESSVVPRVLKYNHQTTENFAVNVDVMNESRSNNNLEGVQITEQDHQTTVCSNNNVDVVVAPVEEHHQISVHENNNVAMEDYQTINANYNVITNVEAANEMIFRNLDDHNSSTLTSLSSLFESDNHGSSYDFGYPIDESWKVGMDDMDFDFSNFSLPK